MRSMRYEESPACARLLSYYPTVPSFALVRTPEVHYLSQIEWEGPRLDHCCGDGFFAGLVQGEGFEAGVDFSESALGEARARRRADGGPFYGQLERADVSARLPWPDASFALVINNSGLEHVEGVAPALAEIARVLRPGGRFAFTLAGARAFEWWPADLPPGSREAYLKHQPIHNTLGLEAWRGALAAAGLELIDYETHFNRAQTEEILRLDYYYCMHAFIRQPLPLRHRLRRKLPALDKRWVRRLLGGAAWHSWPNEDQGSFYCLTARKQGAGGTAR